jgi:hypothetical protein
MVAASSREDLESLLVRSEAGKGSGESLPFDRASVASALERRRGDLEAGEVVPSLLIDSELERLRGD